MRRKMDEKVSGAFGVLRLLEEREAIVRGESAVLRMKLEFLDAELTILYVAVRELQKSIIPMDVNDDG